MLVYRNQPNRRMPRNMGDVLIKERTMQIVASGRRSISIESPSVCDWEGTPQTAGLINIEPISAGLRRRGYLGAGNTLRFNWHAGTRQIRQIVALHSWGLQIDTETEYSEDTDVYQDGYALNFNNWAPKIESDAMVIEAPARLTIYSDNGKETPNILIDPNGDSIHIDYNTRRATEVKSTSIRIIGDRVPTLRKAAQPSGCEATLMISNHADLQNTNTCMALFYGANDVDHPAYGVKGFVPRGIKVTWSSFYLSSGNNMGLDDPSFKALMDQFQTAGNEICPHRVRNGQCNREDNIAYLPTYANDYPPFRTWIDHSLGSGWRCSGIKSWGWDVTKPEYYIMDLLRQYGVMYIWAYIDYDRYKEVIGLDMTRKYHKGWPHYLLYQNTNLTWDNGTPVWQWPSWREYDGAIITRLNQPNIDALIEGQGISIIHSYLASTGREGQSFIVDGDLYVITDVFDEALQRLSAAQSAGKLWIPTIRDWGDYWRSVMQVKITRTSEWTYLLENNSGAEIPGFGLIVSAPVTATINDEATNRKLVKSETFIWFDLPTGESELKIQV